MKNIKSLYIIMFSLVLLAGGLIFTKSAFAVDSVLIAKDFTVWNQGGVVGYDAGFKLVGNATFNGAQSIVIKLYSGNTLLQTNSAIKDKITGAEFITPFDVFGVFNYTKDGYFTNVKSSEYGQTLAPTKVVATVVLADGKIITVTNNHLEGDTNSIGVTPIIGQVLGEESFNFTQLMKEGSTGNDVTELQKFLNNSGYECGVADGKFGKITKSAVIRFQTASGLKGDGIVGSLTRAILNQ